MTLKSEEFGRWIRSVFLSFNHPQADRNQSGLVAEPIRLVPMSISTTTG
jgi:hypothetical protein